MLLREQTVKKRGDDLKKRTMAFALRCARLAESLGKGPTSETVSRQLVRAGTSVAANYRAACRGRSKAEFIAKLGIVEEEADEVLFWIEFAVAAGVAKPELVEELTREGQELLAIIVSSKKTARASKNR